MSVWSQEYTGDPTDLLDLVYDYDGDNLGATGVASESASRWVDIGSAAGGGALSAVESVGGAIVAPIAGATAAVAGAGAVAIVAWTAVAAGGLWVGYKAGIPQAVAKLAEKLAKAL